MSEKSMITDTDWEDDAGDFVDADALNEHANEHLDLDGHVDATEAHGSDGNVAGLNDVSDIQESADVMHDETTGGTVDDAHHVRPAAGDHLTEDAENNFNVASVPEHSDSDHDATVPSFDDDVTEFSGAGGTAGQAVVVDQDGETLIYDDIEGGNGDTEEANVEAELAETASGSEAVQDGDYWRFDVETNADFDIEWTTVTPKTSPASADPFVDVDGSTLEIYYSAEPDDEAAYEWAWIATDGDFIGEASNGGGGGSLDELHSETVTHTGGSSTSFEIENVSTDETAMFDVSYVPQSPTWDGDYALNLDWGRGWDDSEGYVTVHGTLNWDTDPGEDNDLDVTISIQER